MIILKIKELWIFLLHIFLLNLIKSNNLTLKCDRKDDLNNFINNLTHCFNNEKFNVLNSKNRKFAYCIKCIKRKN